MGGDGVTMTKAHIGLGTNLGDRWANLRSALRLIADTDNVRLTRCSPVYETEPWGVADQPKYLNCVTEITTTLQPEPLLAVCKEVEQRLGRLPGPRWGPRLIDLDILLYGSQVVHLPHLEIPHPRLHLRAFALVPLSDLAPDATHPPLGRTIADLAATVDGQESVVPVGEMPLAVEGAEC